MLLAWEVCQWTVCVPKRWASILLDMSMSRNVTIMYLLTHWANTKQQVLKTLEFPVWVKNINSWVLCHTLRSLIIEMRTGTFSKCCVVHIVRYTAEVKHL